MGYRSNVAFAGDEVAKFIIENVVKRDDTFKEFIEYGEDLAYGEAIRIRWDSIKYYDGYEDVDCLNNIMVALDQFSEESYGFMRIGEDVTDIEEKGYPYDFDMYLNRSIEL
mgnify:CR=1 FL=1